MKKNALIPRLVLTIMMMASQISAKAQTLKEMINTKINEVNAHVGVGVIYNGCDTLIINNDNSYPMLSTYKVHLVLKVADYLRSHNIELSNTIKITKEELKENTYSPLQEKFPLGKELSMSELIRYTLQLSDNNTCDILFKLVGGANEVQRYMRSHGFNKCAIEYTEADMRRDIKRAYANHTTPFDAALLMEKIFEGSTFPDDQYNRYIKDILCNCKTGDKRIPCLIRKDGITIAHKTGSGPERADGAIIGINDVGYIKLPNGGA